MQQKLASLAAERDELRLECDNLTTAVSSLPCCSQSSPHMLHPRLLLQICAMQCVRGCVVRCCVGRSGTHTALATHLDAPLCNRPVIQVSKFQEGTAADTADLEGAVRSSQAKSQRDELKSQLAAAIAELAEVRSCPLAYQPNALLECVA